MNLKKLLSASYDIEKCYWVFNNNRFISVKSKMGPSIFVLIISEYHKNYDIIITNNTFRIYLGHDEYITFNKNYSMEEYFNYSTIYDIPSPNELKEIRQHFKKKHKNHQITVYL